MINNNQNKVSVKELTLLVLLIGLAIFMGYIVHLNYPYPVHHDEWMKMAYSKAVIESGSTTYPEPFYGQTTISGITGDMENGFFIFCGILQQVTGINWIDIFVYFPAFLFALTVLSVYILCRRLGFGLEASFLACLLPTSIGLLGPAFMVPLSLGLMIFPLILFLAFNFSCWQGYLLIFIVNSALVLIHGPSAIIILIVLTAFLIANLRRNIGHIFWLSLVLLMPFILVIAIFHSSIISVLSNLLISQNVGNYVRFPDIVMTYGPIPLALSSVGIIYLFVKSEKRDLALIFGLLVLLILLLAFVRFDYGLSIIYERGLVFLLLLLSIIAGAGLSWIGQLRLSLNLKGRHYRFSGAGKILVMIVAAVTISIAVPNHLKTDYYHMIDKSDFDSFNWINENVGDGYRTALIDPWKATAFTAMTRKFTVHRIFLKREAADDNIDIILKNGCSDSTILADNNASFVYNRNNCLNPDLNEINNNIFVVKPETLKRLFEDNLLQNAGFERLSDNYSYPWESWAENIKPDFFYTQEGVNNSHSISIAIAPEITFDPWPQAIWLQSLPVTGGKTYRIAGWIKTNDINGPGGAMLVAHWKAAGDKWISASNNMEYIKGSNGWTYYQGNVTAPQGAIKCTVCCLLAGCSGQVWFDNILFQPAE